MPNPLLDGDGKPILQHVVEGLTEQGINEIVLAVGYKHEKIKKFFGSGEKFGAKIKYIVEKEFLGTGGALKNAERMLHERFLMLNGDNLADFDYSAMEKLHEQEKALATIALVEVADPSAYGVAELQGKKIIRFIEKPPKGKAPSNLINAGAYVLEKKALKFLPSGFNLIEKTLFPELAKQDRLAGYRHSGKWFALDTKEKLEEAKREWKK